MTRRITDEELLRGRGDYHHKRVRSPRLFDPGSFRIVDPGRSGCTKLVVACPKGQYKKGRCRVGTQLQAMLYEKACGKPPWAKRRGKS